MRKAYPTFIAKCGEDYLAYVPDMEINTEGKDIADAIEMARDAICSKTVVMEKHDIPVPEPGTYEAAMKKAEEEADIFDYRQGMLTLVDVDVEAYKRKLNQKTVRRSVTIPGWMNEAAEERHLNVSRILQDALREQLQD